MQQLNSGLKRGRVFSRACRARSGCVLFLGVRSNRIRLLTSRILVPGHSHTSPPLGPLVWKILQTFDRHRRLRSEEDVADRGSITHAAAVRESAATSRQHRRLAASSTSGIHGGRFHHQAPGTPVLICYLEA